MSDLLLRIMSDVEKVKAQYGIRSEEITVYMTYRTITKISMENFGFVPAIDETTFCGHKTRIMDGKGIEWDIGISHGFSFDRNIREGKNNATD